jgi:hypothetical protein
MRCGLVGKFRDARVALCAGVLLVSAFQSLVVAQQRDASEWRVPVEPQQDVLLSHTIGKDGIPFPKPEDFKWKPDGNAATSPQALPTQTPLPTPTPYQQPKRCSRNETQAVVYKEKESETELFTDYLFIPEELIPLDPEEVFGSEVSLVPYGPEAGEGGKIRMEINEVPCVPYRRRLTNTTRYFDTGINALKNYDGAPGGSGKLHPLMQQKLKQTSRGLTPSRPMGRQLSPPRRQ